MTKRTLTQAISSSSVGFPCGLSVYLRTTDPNGGLHSVSFPSGRDVIYETISDRFIHVLNSDRESLGHFLVDAVSVILPLFPEVPSDANN